MFLILDVGNGGFYRPNFDRNGREASFLLDFCGVRSYSKISRILCAQTPPGEFAPPRVGPSKGKENASMLVLSRKKNESIVINDQITIVVVEIRGDKVRLGIEAPKDVPVHRREVYESIIKNQQKAPSANAEQAASTPSASSETA